MSAAETLIISYYDAFNRGDMQTFLSLLDDDVVHDINHGGRECGKTAFSEFMAKMSRHYQEQVTDLVVMADKSGTRVAAEFRIKGTYLVTDSGLPVAKGQKYDLPVGAFFEINGGKVSRVTNYYNLKNWIAMVE